MSLVVDVAGEGIRAAVSRARLREIALAVLEAERVEDAMVSIALVTPQQIARLNRAHLGHAGSTDVISFALGATPGGGRQPVVGDIYIAPAVARANAARFGRGVREELARLVIHGVLHVLGHEHPEGLERTRSAMWRRQERLLAATQRAPARRSARSARKSLGKATRRRTGSGGRA